MSHVRAIPIPCDLAPSEYGNRSIWNSQRGSIELFGTMSMYCSAFKAICQFRSEGVFLALGEAEKRRTHRQGIDKNRCVYPILGVNIAWVMPRIEGRESGVMAVSAL